MKNQVWVVVANGAVARIFAESESQSLTETEILEHPETRIHGRDLVSSKPGRTFDSNGSARHSMEPPRTPQQNEAHQFAAEVAKHLEHARHTNLLKKLYVIASPAFLGSLRNLLSAPLKEIIALEVDKDATSKSPIEIRAYLPFRL